MKRLVVAALVLLAASACAGDKRQTTVATSTPTTAAPTTTTTTTTSDDSPTVTLGDWTGRRPAAIYFSGDSGNIVFSITWTEWGAQRAVGHGTRNELDCVPDCATGKATPYPATVTLSQPVGGHFTNAVEVTADGDGTTDSFHSPRMAEGACTTWDPNSTDSCKVG